MKPEAVLTVLVFTTAATSFTSGVHLSKDLIIPAVFALTAVRASFCSAYVVSSPPPNPEGWGVERRHRGHHGQQNNNNASTNSAANNGTAADGDGKKHRGKHHDKDRSKGSSKHKNKDGDGDGNKNSAPQTNNDGDGNNGNASQCTSAAAMDSTGNANSAGAGNSTGSLPPGFPPPVPQPGFVAGQKRKRQVSHTVKRENMPRAPERAIFETLYD